MTESRFSPGEAADLRWRAEEKTGTDWVNYPERLSPAEVRKVFQELRVHQVELEMQNEELRRAQAELETSRARYFDLYDLAPVGYCTLGDGGLILEANLTAAGLLGVARSDLLKQPLTGFILPKDQDIYYRHRKQVLETGSPQVCELRMTRSNGSQFWARIEAIKARDDGNGAPACRAVISDITARKWLEEKLWTKNAEVEYLNKAVSHDLKSPLATIKIYLGFLEKDIRDQNTERIDKNLEVINRVSDKMFRLLDDLRGLSGAGRVMNHVEEAPLQAIVREALDLVAGQIAERDVVVEVTKEPVMLHGDRGRLVDVFQNLVDNAVKFMGDQEKPRVEIGVEHEGDETVFLVRDNGIGIDPRHRAKIFGMFEKLDSGAAGTGIGLALVKRTVEVHGGRIWVESEGANKGATFRFTLARTGQRGI